MRNIIVIGGIIVLLVAGVWWSRSASTDKGEVISKSGIHWHSTLHVYNKGEKMAIPADIGVGPQYASVRTFDTQMGMAAVHTHAADGVIHLEFPGMVLEEDTTLGNFFAIWGRDSMDFGSSVRMTVNGEESEELLNYRMRDGDVIELRYE
ncbi:MAG: hypothetical protein HY455_01505 [Parcubacteria group bacterium]|nr:hypothetical protein [Parcubacteria group bacterium]